MSFLIKLYLFSLFVLLDYRFVRALNETCGNDQPSCLEPLNCTYGHCLCSPIGKPIDEKNPYSFWTGDQCIPCPPDYISTGTKCYKLIIGKDNQMSWIRARTQCQESGADLVVIRSEKEFNLFSAIIRNVIGEDDMFLRTPLNGTRFASVWIGARLLDGTTTGTFELVADGPAITKDSYYWCSQSSLLGLEPSHTALKATGEYQECLGLAVLPGNHVCMHDWFCSWESFTLCELHPPPPVDISVDPGIEPLEAQPAPPNNTMFYMGIFGGGFVLILIAIGIFYFICHKKKTIRSSRSIESTASGLSEN